MASEGGDKRAATINIGSVSGFEMVAGKDVSNDGVIGYNISLRRIDGEGYMFFNSKVSKVGPPPDGFEYYVSPIWLTEQSRILTF